MRNRKRGQGLVLLTLAVLVLIAGASVWLLISEKPDNNPKVQKPASQPVDARR
jgi:hypothetical protein